MLYHTSVVSNTPGAVWKDCEFEVTLHYRVQSKGNGKILKLML